MLSAGTTARSGRRLLTTVSWASHIIRCLRCRAIIFQPFTPFGCFPLYVAMSDEFEYGPESDLDQAQTKLKAERAETLMLTRRISAAKLRLAFALRHHDINTGHHSGVVDDNHPAGGSSAVSAMSSPGPTVLDTRDGSALRQSIEVECQICGEPWDVNVDWLVILFGEFPQPNTTPKVFCGLGASGRGGH